MHVVILVKLGFVGSTDVQTYAYDQPLCNERPYSCQTKYLSVSVVVKLSNKIRFIKSMSTLQRLS